MYILPPLHIQQPPCSSALTPFLFFNSPMYPQGIGMEVLAYDIRKNPVVEAMGVPYLPWEDILPQVDVLSLHLPLLPSTQDFMDRQK